MFKSSQVKSFDRLPYGCLLFMYRLDLNVNSHRRCTTIRLVSYGTGSTVNVEGNLKRRAAILLYADPRPGTGRGRRAPRAHTVIRSSQRPVSRHAESRKRDSGCANGVSATYVGPARGSTPLNISTAQRLVQTGDARRIDRRSRDAGPISTCETSARKRCATGQPVPDDHAD